MIKVKLSSTGLQYKKVLKESQHEAFKKTKSITASTSHKTHNNDIGPIKSWKIYGSDIDKKTLQCEEDATYNSNLLQKQRHFQNFAGYPSHKINITNATFKDKYSLSAAGKSKYTSSNSSLNIPTKLIKEVRLPSRSPSKVGTILIKEGKPLFNSSKNHNKVKKPRKKEEYSEDMYLIKKKPVIIPYKIINGKKYCLIKEGMNKTFKVNRNRKYLIKEVGSKNRSPKKEKFTSHLKIIDSSKTIPKGFQNGSNNLAKSVSSHLSLVNYGSKPSATVHNRESLSDIHMKNWISKSKFEDTSLQEVKNNPHSSISDNRKNTADCRPKFNKMSDLSEQLNYSKAVDQNKSLDHEQNIDNVEKEQQNPAMNYCARSTARSTETLVEKKLRENERKENANNRKLDEAEPTNNLSTKPKFNKNVCKSNDTLNGEPSIAALYKSTKKYGNKNRIDSCDDSFTNSNSTTTETESYCDDSSLTSFNTPTKIHSPPCVSSPKEPSEFIGKEPNVVLERLPVLEKFVAENVNTDILNSSYSFPCDTSLVSNPLSEHMNLINSLNSSKHSEDLNISNSHNLPRRSERRNVSKSHNSPKGSEDLNVNNSHNLSNQLEALEEDNSHNASKYSEDDSLEIKLDPFADELTLETNADFNLEEGEEDTIDIKLEPMNYDDIDTIAQEGNCDENAETSTTMVIDSFGRVIVKEEIVADDEQITLFLDDSEGSNFQFEGFEDSNPDERSLNLLSKYNTNIELSPSQSNKITSPVSKPTKTSSPVSKPTKTSSPVSKPTITSSPVSRPKRSSVLSKEMSKEAPQAPEAAAVNSKNLENSDNADDNEPTKEKRSMKKKNKRKLFTRVKTHTAPIQKVEKKNVESTLQKILPIQYACISCSFSTNSKPTLLLHSKTHEKVKTREKVNTPSVMARPVKPSSGSSAVKSALIHPSVMKKSVPKPGSMKAPAVKTPQKAPRLKLPPNKLSSGQVTSVIKTNKDIQFHCNLCGFKATTSGNLFRHVRTHKGFIPYQCIVCKLCFSCAISLKNHIANNHTRAHDLNNSKRYTCYKCFEHFPFKAALDNHKRIHHEEEKITCPLCEMEFKDKVTLKHHLKSHTPSDCNQYDGLVNEAKEHKQNVFENKKSVFREEDAQFKSNINRRNRRKAPELDFDSSSNSTQSLHHNLNNEEENNESLHRNQKQKNKITVTECSSGNNREADLGRSEGIPAGTGSLSDSPKSKGSTLLRKMADENNQQIKHTEQALADSSVNKLMDSETEFDESQRSSIRHSRSSRRKRVQNQEKDDPSWNLTQEEGTKRKANSPIRRKDKKRKNKITQETNEIENAMRNGKTKLSADRTEGNESTDTAERNESCGEKIFVKEKSTNIQVIEGITSIKVVDPLELPSKLTNALETEAVSKDFVLLQNKLKNDKSKKNTESPDASRSSLPNNLINPLPTDSTEEFAVDSDEDSISNMEITDQKIDNEFILFKTTPSGNSVTSTQTATTATDKSTISEKIKIRVKRVKPNAINDSSEELLLSNNEGEEKDSNKIEPKDSSSLSKESKDNRSSPTGSEDKKLLSQENIRDETITSTGNPEKEISDTSNNMLCFKCNFCSFKADRRYILNKHLEDHSSMRPFECSFCPQTFLNSGDLKMHIKEHDDDDDDDDDIL